MTVTYLAHLVQLLDCLQKMLRKTDLTIFILAQFTYMRYIVKFLQSFVNERQMDPYDEIDSKVVKIYLNVVKE